MRKESRTKKTIHVEDGILDLGWDTLCELGSHCGSIYGELGDGWTIERARGREIKRTRWADRFRYYSRRTTTIGSHRSRGLMGLYDNKSPTIIKGRHLSRYA